MTHNPPCKSGCHHCNPITPTGRPCGICGEKDTKKLVGPFAGGPFQYYCKHCYSIIDDYNDSGVVRDEEVICQYIEAVKKHEETIKEIIREVKISSGLHLVFASDANFTEGSK